MKSNLNSHNVSYDDIQATVNRYKSHVPSKISGLEKLRLEEVPEVLKQRKADGDAFLEKTDVTSLVEWKLYIFVHSPSACIRLLTTRDPQETWHLSSKSLQTRLRKQC